MNYYIYLFEIKILLCLAFSTDLLHVDRMLILVYPLSEQVMVTFNPVITFKNNNVLLRTLNRI